MRFRNADSLTDVFKGWRETLNVQAVFNNPLVEFGYWLAYPLARFGQILKVTPNQVTVASAVAAILAFASLVTHNVAAFVGLWLLSILFDYVDGQLARLTSRISSFPLNVDHLSDLFKISLLFLGFGIFFDSRTIWVLAFTALFSFLYFSILNHLCGSLQLRSDRLSFPNQNRKEAPTIQNEKNTRRRIRGALSRGPERLRRNLSKIYTILVTFNAHTLLVFILVPINHQTAVVSLAYLIGLSLWNSFHLLSRVLRYSGR